MATYCLALPLLALVANPAMWGIALFVFTAQLLGLRCAFGIIVATSLVIVLLAPAVGTGWSSAKRILMVDFVKSSDFGQDIHYPRQW